MHPFSAEEFAEYEKAITEKLLKKIHADMEEALIYGVPVRTDPALPSDRMELREKNGEVIGRFIRKDGEWVFRKVKE